jgi:hypothetical protein
MDIGPLPDWIQQIGGVLGGAGGIKTLERLFRVQPKDIPVCQTRVMRAARGLPWDKQIGVHPLKDGRIEVKLLDV